MECVFKKVPILNMECDFTKDPFVNHLYEIWNMIFQKLKKMEENDLTEKEVFIYDGYIFFR